MTTSNNQIILDEIYDENVQPSEEEIVEYAVFIGIDPNEVIVARDLEIDLLSIE